jgi:alpha-N-arabinofuranosidase
MVKLLLMTRLFHPRALRRLAWLFLGAAALLAGSAQAQPPPAAQLVIHADQPGPKINRQVFGHFAEHLGHGIYGGVWVGEDSPIPNIRGYRRDVVEALREIAAPVIRWPGGCFADEYHWRDGVGPRATRPVKINTNWGGVAEPNSFGTHEFMEFAELVGAQAYVAGNVGSAPPSEMQDWIEYMTSPVGSTLAKARAANGRTAPWKLAYFGIGNELWGCGGTMRPPYAVDVTRRYSTFIHSAAGQHILKIASGPNGDDYAWTEAMVQGAAKQIDGLGLHYYTVVGSWAHKGRATGFDEAAWAEALAKAGRMDELITRHAAVMDRYDPGKRLWLVVDEWGAWYEVERGTNPGFLYQQNSLRDAVLAAQTLNIFIRHADRVKMATLAQMVNVLQSVILTDGPRMVRTPTYQVFALYKPFQDATSLPVEVTGPVYAKGAWSMPAVSASAARDAAGVVHVALANLDPNRPIALSAQLPGLAVRSVRGRVLTAARMDTVNTFDQPGAVVPQPFTGAALEEGRLSVRLPAKSVVVLDLQ